MVAGLVGREVPIARLTAMVERAAGGERVTALVAGQAGIGKTSILRTGAAQAAERGFRTGWGTAVEGGGAPGYWPWTQVLNGLARDVGVERAGELAGPDRGLLATVATALGTGDPGAAPDQARLLLADATTRWLAALAAEAPVMIVFDDLQWADDSSLALLEFVARAPQPTPLCLLGAYRHDELAGPSQLRISSLLGAADHLQVEGLDPAAVHTLVEHVVGGPIPSELSATIHRRSAGHPFFVRELALHSVTAGATAPVPVAVRDAIDRRLDRLPSPTRDVLAVAAVAGVEISPDVVAAALDSTTVDVEAATRPAVTANVLVVGDNGRLRFSHDLFRETIEAALDPARRMAIHRAVGAAMEDRARRGGDTIPAELARHFSASIAIDGTERAGRWALAAAAADRTALAFVEAAGHPRRFRAAASDAGVPIADDRLVDVLLAEADALARAGSPLDAKGLLRVARDVATHADDAGRIARVALAAAHLGSRFAARRDELIRDLEEALERSADLDLVLEAQLTATLARELQHSIAAERVRAGPLSERALEFGRLAGDPAALQACLLARHDVLWTPGTAGQRVEIAQEIVAVARHNGDDEGAAQGLLLLANAELERGSAAYSAALDECLHQLDELGQPRHRYTAETRRAALALLHGDLDDAAGRIDDAASLGYRIREPDTGNVHMSQRLELVRARGDPDELHAFAVAAITHWTGAPVHANAVAAGFHARAGNLDRARQHVAAVLDLGTWRADRSYLWSVFIRELSWAAVAIDDRDLCAQLLDDLLPLENTCGVNGAVVAFAGSHAHTAGLVAAALDRPDAAALLARARDTYRRLAAHGWLHELGPSSSGPPPPGRPASTIARMVRAGRLWHIDFAGQEVTVPDAKGLADIATLTSRPGTDVHALELIGSRDRSASGGAVLDQTALRSYRQRLAELDDDADEAAQHHDDARLARVAAERDALLAELQRATTPTGQARQFANHPAERARKAVSARIRATIANLDAVLPELADHLNRAIITGTYCRYRPDRPIRWEITSRPPDEAP